MAQLDRNKIESNGWRQGAACHTNLIREAAGQLLFDLHDDDLAILVSHDCDIVHHNATSEPVVEWLCVHPISKVDGSFLHGKNPRRLHFEHCGKCYEALAYKRFVTPREVLVKFSVGSIPPLSSKLTNQVANWVAKRYSRPAFPDDFNNRIGDKRAAIADVIGEAHEFLRAILISVQPGAEDLPADRAYTVSLVGVMARADYVDALKREACQAHISEIESLLSGCDGIDVEDCVLRPDTEVSLADLEFLVEWDFDYLTVADDAVPEFPV